MWVRIIASGPGTPELGDHDLDEEIALALIEQGKALALSPEDQVQPHNLGYQGRRVRGDGWA